MRFLKKEKVRIWAFTTLGHAKNAVKTRIRTEFSFGAVTTRAAIPQRYLLAHLQGDVACFDLSIQVGSTQMNQNVPKITRFSKFPTQIGFELS